MERDPLAKMKALLEQVVAGKGALDPDARRAAARAEAATPELTAYVAKVQRHAYRVTDEEVQALLAGGASEDQIFEASVCAALGAALERLEAGLRPLGGK